MESSSSAGRYMLSDVQRRYVDVGERAVHYRVTGQGPAVVMLHDSPRSSRLHLETMTALSHRFRVYALDTPGYGNSAPLAAAEPTIADFAAALADTLEALQLQGAPIYATHTSAKIALEYGASRTGASAPSAKLILDGLSIPVGPPDPAFISAYMRPFRIDPSGSYLAAEWTRMRDMLRWFPWFDQRPDKRMPVATPSDAWISAYMIDFLSAGPAYASAYAAAMYYDPLPALQRVASPVLVAARSDDVLYSSLDRVPVVANPALSVERLPADRDAWLAWLEASLAAAVGTTPVAAQDIPQPEHGARYVDLPEGTMRVHRAGSGGTPTLILSAPTTLHALAWQAALPARATLVPELPGFGESSALPAPTLPALADALAAMLDGLDIATVDVVAIGFASPLGALFAHRHPKRVSRVVLDGCFEIGDGEAFARELAPGFPFDLGGGHIHRTWHMLRDAEAGWPWHDRSAQSPRATEPTLDACALHDALVGILKQPAAYGDAAKAACTGERYPAFRHSALLLDRPADPGYTGTRAVAERLPNVQVVERPSDLAATARIADAFLKLDQRVVEDAL